MSRGDPWGLDVRWDVGGPAAVAFVHVRLLDDGTQGWQLGFEQDARATKGFRVKPVQEGVFDLYVMAEDVRGRCNFTVALTKVTVVK